MSRWALGILVGVVQWCETRDSTPRCLLGVFGLKGGKGCEERLAMPCLNCRARHLKFVRCPCLAPFFVAVCTVRFRVAALPLHFAYAKTALELQVTPACGLWDGVFSMPAISWPRLDFRSCINTSLACC